MPPSITGSCNCGAITLTVHEDLFETPARGHLCHCENCRKTSGSFVASNLAIARASVEVGDEGGRLKRYRDVRTGSGKVVERCFCGVCGSAIMSVPEIFPDLYILKTGIFPRIPKPECESFVAHRQSWEGDGGKERGLVDGVVLFDTVRGGAIFGGEGKGA